MSKALTTTPESNSHILLKRGIRSDDLRTVSTEPETKFHSVTVPPEILPSSKEEVMKGTCLMALLSSCNKKMRISEVYFDDLTTGL